MATSVANAGATNKRWQKHSKWHWTREEDFLLTLLVHRHGAGNWDYIANHIEGRSGKSCRVRWINQLNPRINKSPFSIAEKQRLLELHETYGNKWSTIATFFSGRTDNQLKNQYHVLVRTRCMKASALSSSTDSYSPPVEGGPIGLSNYGIPYTIPPDSQFSNVSYPGTNYYKFFPSAVADNIQMPPSAMPGSFQMMLSFSDGSSLTSDMGESSLVPPSTNPYWLHPYSFDGANLEGTGIPYHVASLGGSGMSIASAAAFPEMDAVNLPVQGGAMRELINFLGIQNQR